MSGPSPREGDAGAPRSSDPPEPDQDLDDLRRRVAEILGDPGALITSSFTAYWRAFPTHLAVKNAGLLDEASGAELWWGDLDLTRRIDAVRAAARAVGRPLLVVYESGRRALDTRVSLHLGDWDVVARIRPDGSVELSHHAGYRRGTRVYRQTAAGSARWARRHRRRDPALLSARERDRLLRRLAGVAPVDLPAAITEAHLALIADLDADRVVLTIPALELRGQGADMTEALADLGAALAASRRSSRDA